MRPLALAFAAAAAVVALVGCGSERQNALASAPSVSVSASPTPSPPASSLPKPTPTAIPSASPSRFGVRYVDAFEDFWVAYAAADRDADPNSSALSSTATGAALVWARTQIAAHVKLGVTHQGTFGFRSVGADHVTARSALVGQCMDWSHWPVVNRTTGASLQRFGAYSQLADSQLVVSGGQWRVATVRVRDVAC